MNRPVSPSFVRLATWAYLKTLLKADAAAAAAAATITAAATAATAAVTTLTHTRPKAAASVSAFCLVLVLLELKNMLALWQQYHCITEQAPDWEKVRVVISVYDPLTPFHKQHLSLIYLNICFDALSVFYFLSLTLSL